ncbi:MAG: acyl carrier protein [Atopobiaceae bacterium]|jgi:acyl carrier protein|nr:acyl carrier protein [Atopobiaceae bacterium]MDO4405125.1 phosphopantetheine-binding protein [Atopobiaceae bacterium]
MDRIIEILSSIKSGVDFANEDQIVSGGILDSIDITELITALEEEFDIEIGMEYMENENFDSVEAIWDMVQELQEA